MLSYEMADIESRLHLTRDKLVALALLCGNDYDPKGLSGVGLKRAFGFVTSFAIGESVLDRMRGWRIIASRVAEMSNDVTEVGFHPFYYSHFQIIMAVDDVMQCKWDVDFYLQDHDYYKFSLAGDQSSVVEVVRKTFHSLFHVEKRRRRFVGEYFE